MPLEQIRGDARTASDLYALGMTMVVALSGTDVQALPYDDSTGKVALKRALPPGVSARLREAIGSMVEPMVGRRAHSASEVAARLKETADTHHAVRRIEPPLRSAVAVPPPAEPEPPSPPPSGPASRDSEPDNPWKKLLIPAVVVALLGVVLVGVRLSTAPGLSDMVSAAQGSFTRHFQCAAGAAQARNRPDLRPIDYVDYKGRNADHVLEVTGCGHDVMFACSADSRRAYCSSGWKEQAVPPTSPSASARVAKDAGPPARVVDLMTDPFTVTWTGHLDASTGAAPPIGSTCSVTATMAMINRIMERQRIVFECKGTTLFDSKDFSGGTSTRDFAPTESLVDKTDDGQLAYAYRLRAYDIGTRLIPQIAFDTGKQTLDAWQDTTSPFRVHAVLDRLSSPRYGKPVYAETRVPFTQVVTRSAKVTAKTGKVPFSVPSCRLRIAPAWYTTSNCRVRLECGGTTVYGDGLTGLRSCALVQSQPIGLRDPDPTPTDGSPELTFGLDVASATLADTLKNGSRYSVSFSLEGPESDAGGRVR